MEGQKRLMLIRGNSGSGKTSAARLLRTQMDGKTLLISQDAVRIDMFWDKNAEAVPLIGALMEYGYAQRECTILEGILDAARYKPVFERALALFGAENIFAYYYDIPFEETLRRHQLKNRADFGEEDMRRWWKEKDWIGLICETILTKDMSLEDAVAKMLADMQRPMR